MAPVIKPKHDRGKTYLREWRKYKGITQDRAAERLDIDPATLSRIENSKLPYNQDFLERAALAYGCEVTDLLTINPLRPDPPRLVYNRLLAASRETQERALAILDALLKAS